MNATISSLIASEVAGIQVGGARYRATRSSRLASFEVDAPTESPPGPWTLWHDYADGGSHTVGHADAYEGLEHAVEAAAEHDVDCTR